jgi:signal transduction histidine kinase
MQLTPIKQYVYAAIAIIIVSMGFAIYIQSNTINILDEKIKVKELQVSNFTKTIKDQNESIERMKTAGTELSNKLLEAETNVKAKEKETVRLVTLIRNTPVPKDCEGALGHMSQYMKESAEKWNSSR